MARCLGESVMKPSKISYKEAVDLINHLKKIFYVARLVDVTVCKQYAVSEDGKICKCNEECYYAWNKKCRCENCISSKAYQKKGTLSKFEFIDDNIFYVITTYVEVDGTPYMLEMVQQIVDESVLGNYGKCEFVESITDYTKRLYIDVLTGAYNRNYYEEQLDHIERYQAFAMIDADNFKGVNDTFGHHAGDIALQRIAETIRKHIRESDELVRYGGDEFILVLPNIPEQAFSAKLEEIRIAVSEQRFDEFPGMKLSVSIGGYYHPEAKGEALIEADAMLYKAKRTKNCVEIKYSDADE